jgi:16S rRNA (guanine(527)-N(7))-methyltransferase RsmG
MPSANLPDYSLEEFQTLLAATSAVDLAPAVGAALHAHYQELRRWSKSLALVGPAFAAELFERHYAESLAGLDLLPAGPGRLLDLGSGAGFPGIVLAAARPDLEVTLLEARERKWAFLAAASRRAGLDCRCLNARVSANPADLPAELSEFTIVTVRALKLEPSVWREVGRRMSSGGRLLLWSGEEAPMLPEAFAAGRVLHLSGRGRYLREVIYLGDGAENR